MALYLKMKTSHFISCTNTGWVWGCRSVRRREGVCWVWPAAPSAMGGVYSPSAHEAVCEDWGGDLWRGLLHHQCLWRHSCTQSMCVLNCFSSDLTRWCRLFVISFILYSFQWGWLHCWTKMFCDQITVHLLAFSRAFECFSWSSFCYWNLLRYHFMVLVGNSNCMISGGYS